MGGGCTRLFDDGGHLCALAHPHGAFAPPRGRNARLVAGENPPPRRLRDAHGARRGARRAFEHSRHAAWRLFAQDRLRRAAGHPRGCALRAGLWRDGRGNHGFSPGAALSQGGVCAVFYDRRHVLRADPRAFLCKRAGA